ncbi:DgyrCDS3082 [Dimorphilus gyrociliatus]|uniref:DgyrCDS3082 n=1 Tax=Dimorphilus gyrociliatus TaxID=2664684 RepID=A0A7I8VE11_9ANNE|nr:DgyrCDS3082 [Dimorphilus gyrociliatus]
MFSKVIHKATAENEISNAPVIINYNGDVTWFEKSVYKSTCSMTVTNYPFDVQTCNLWFGSWTHPIYEIDFRILGKQGLDVSQLEKYSVWEVSSTEVDRKEHGGGKIPTYSIITFRFELKRRLTFMNGLLIVPCIILSSLTLTVFCLPPSRPDRTMLAMSLFASFLFLLLMLVETAPPSASSTPKLG